MNNQSEYNTWTIPHEVSSQSIQRKDPLRCLLILSAGETIEGFEELQRSGFIPVAYPSTQDLSSLTDAAEQESAKYLGRNPAFVERRHVRSLRASFIRLLRDHRFDDDDMVIFGESDACPEVGEAKLKSALIRELSEHPETDVFRLFHHSACQAGSGPANDDELIFEEFKTASRDPDTPYVWGTHAMVIPARSRERVARVFADYRLPTDIALGASVNSGKLHIRTAQHNLFYQKKRKINLQR